MAGSRRKSTDNVQRKAVRQVDAEVREITPQEKRRQILLNVGVWFLVIVFCMTSGIMCFSIGGKEQKEEAGQNTVQAVDEVQSEIDRYSKDLSTDSQNPEILANLGYYWIKKGLTSPTAKELKEIEAKEAKKTADKKDEAAENKAPEHKVSREEAFANAHDYLTKALDIDKNHIFAKKNLADLNVQEERYAEARKAYNEVIEYCRQPVKVKEGEDEVSIQAARNSNLVDADLSLAKLNVVDNKQDEALTCLQDAVKVDAGNIEAYHMMAMIYGSRRDYAKAHESMKSALLIAVNMGEADQALTLYMENAQLYKMEGNKEEAKKCLKEAQGMIPAQAQGQAQAIRQMLQKQIDEIDGKKPEAPKAAPAEDKASEAAPAEDKAAEAAPAEDKAAEAAPAEDKAAEAAPADEKAAD